MTDRQAPPDLGRLPEEPPSCFLCGRPVGRRVEFHHPVPRSKGGRTKVPVHPICHRAIHRAVDNKALARAFSEAQALRAHPELRRFVEWIADKAPDFHAPTRRPGGRGRRR